MTDAWASTSYNAEGIDVEKDFEPIPPGRYDLQVEEAVPSVSKNGYKMVTVTFKVIDSLKYNGKKIMFHNVTILPPSNAGAFLAVKFLRAIGQPYKGAFSITPANWVGERLSAQVSIESYQDKKGQTRQKNTVESGSVVPYQGNTAELTKKEEEEIPF